VAVDERERIPFFRTLASGISRVLNQAGLCYILLHLAYECWLGSAVSNTKKNMKAGVKLLNAGDGKISTLDSRSYKVERHMD